jgi:hypothetical protein
MIVTNLISIECIRYGVLFGIKDCLNKKGSDGLEMDFFK